MKDKEMEPITILEGGMKEPVIYYFGRGNPITSIVSETWNILAAQ